MLLPPHMSVNRLPCSCNVTGTALLNCKEGYMQEVEVLFYSSEFGAKGFELAV